MNEVNNKQESPLFTACKKGNEEIVELLLAANADVNKADNNGCTPLAKAAYYGHTKIVEALLQTKGININSIDKWGETPLSTAVNGAPIESIQLLLLHNVCMIEYKMKMI